jgi:hypothetical protein
LDDITRKELICYELVEGIVLMRMPKFMINSKPEGRENEVVPEEPGKIGYIQQ